MALVAAVATAGVLAYSNDRVAEIRRTTLGGALATDELEPGAAQNYLIVGIDDAGRLPEGDVVRERDIGPRLTDTIMVMRVDPTAAAAEVLSFPRDLLVDIPGRSTRARINSAFETDGPEGLVETIDLNFGIPIHHYLEVDFAGFRELVSIIGGVPVHFPHPVRSQGGSETGDPTVQLDIPEAGCWTLGPVQALGFARVRKDFQVQDADGDWHTDPGGDYSRVERQQLFVRLALQQAIAKGARNVATLRRLVDTGVTHVVIDDGLEPESLVELSRSFRSFDPDELVTYTLPVDEASGGGPAYLYLREDEAEPILARFRGDPMEGAPLTELEGVTVRVSNGTGTPNQARDVSDLLGLAGFTTVLPAADTPPGFPTLVRFDEGGASAARTVAAWIDGGVVFEATDLPEGVDVELVTGDDWGGVRSSPRSLDGVEIEVPGADESTGTTAPTVDDTTVDDTWPQDATGPVEQPLGDVDDPDDDAFYRVHAPAPDAECRPTE